MPRCIILRGQILDSGSMNAHLPHSGAQVLSIRLIPAPIPKTEAIHPGLFGPDSSPRRQAETAATDGSNGDPRHRSRHTLVIACERTQPKPSHLLGQGARNVTIGLLCACHAPTTICRPVDLCVTLGVHLGLRRAARIPSKGNGHMAPMHRLPVSASGVWSISSFLPVCTLTFETLHAKGNASRCPLWRELVLLHKSHMEALSCT